MIGFFKALEKSKFIQLPSHLAGTELDPGKDIMFKFGDKGQYELWLEPLLDGSKAVGGKPVYYLALYENGELMTGEKLAILPHVKPSEEEHEE